MTEEKRLSASATPWQKVVAFLNRDLSTFFRRADVDGPSGGGTAFFDIPPDLNVKSLVDPGKLQELVFQRTILDWRDGAHARITASVINLQQEFTSHIDAELGKASFFKSLISKPSDEILGESFQQRVVKPLMAVLHREQTALAACIDQGGRSPLQRQWFDGQILNTDVAWLRPWAFKPSKQKEIVEGVHAWMLGGEGLASRLRKQVTYTADSLMEKSRSC